MNQLTGAVLAAGEGIRAVQRQAGASLSQFAPGRGTVGAGGAFANGSGVTLGRSQVDRSFGGLGGELSRRQAGIGVEPLGIAGGVGAALGGSGGGSSAFDSALSNMASKVKKRVDGCAEKRHQP